MSDGTNRPPVTAWFGGSFDPPHFGHLGVAKMALASGCCQRVLWCPAYLPPHKSSRERADFSVRLMQVQELISGEENMAASDIENRLKLTPSYTAEVLKHLEQELPGELVLLIGEDTLAQLHLWYQAQYLAEKYQIFTYPRSGWQLEKAVLEQHWSPELAEKLWQNRLAGEFFRISSTQIRNSRNN